MRHDQVTSQGGDLMTSQLLPAAVPVVTALLLLRLPKRALPMLAAVAAAVLGNITGVARTIL